MKRLGDAGWLHRLRDPQRPRRGGARRVMLREWQSTAHFAKLAERYQAAVDPIALIRLAGSLGVSRDSLCRLRIGWDGEAWCFPMADAGGHVIGIRRRLPNGRKLAVHGGREGLFIPTGLATVDPLLIAEGPTDTAALLTLGFSAWGRPSCRGGVDLLRLLVRGRSVVVVADTDKPGRRGAQVLAVALAPFCSRVRVIQPADGSKDARQWLVRGATAADVRSAIEASNPIQIQLQTRTAGH